jgi:hypothetical protein
MAAGKEKNTGKEYKQGLIHEIIAFYGRKINIFCRYLRFWVAALKLNLVNFDHPKKLVIENPTDCSVDCVFIVFPVVAGAKKSGFCFGQGPG